MVTGRMSGGQLEFKTSEDRRGHSTVLQLTPTAVVPSTDASASTLKRRASEMIRQAESISGGSDGARVQLIAGLKKLSATAQEALLHEAGLWSSSPAAGTALAIKADLRLPWSQLRKLRQWLKVFGVKIESEHSMRSFIATTLPTYTALEVPMAKKNGEVVMAPMVFFLDLIAVVMNHLDILHESQRLTWHDGVILENEIWKKLQEIMVVATLNSASKLPTPQVQMPQVTPFLCAPSRRKTLLPTWKLPWAATVSKLSSSRNPPGKERR